jgi:hypothetical protein
MTEFLLGLLAGIGVAYVYWKVRVYLIYRMVQRQMQDMQYLLNTAQKAVVADAVRRGEVQVVPQELVR